MTPQTAEEREHMVKTWEAKTGRKRSDLYKTNRGPGLARVDPSDFSKWKKVNLPDSSDMSGRIVEALKVNPNTGKPIRHKRQLKAEDLVLDIQDDPDSIVEGLNRRSLDGGPFDIIPYD